MNSIASVILLLSSVSTIAYAADYSGTCDKPQASTPPGYNNLVMDAVRSMPQGGGYDASDARIDALKSAVNVKNGTLEVDPQKAGKSFCSAATYMVFLKVISEQQKKGGLELSPETLQELKVQSKSEQPDGTGAWGRWNADGPGTAALFKDLNIGRNFSSINDARPGDFLKIFWNDKIGRGEKGHSVVFDSVRTCKVDGKSVKHICFWSSNTSNDSTVPGDKGASDGWGMKCVPQSKAVRTLFSRIQSLTNLNNAPEAIGKQSGNYVHKELASLDKRSLSPYEMGAIVNVGAAVTPLESRVSP